jgi:hypothetical protein
VEVADSFVSTALIAPWKYNQRSGVMPSSSATSHIPIVRLPEPGHRRTRRERPGNLIAVMSSPEVSMGTRMT